MRPRSFFGARFPPEANVPLRIVRDRLRKNLQRDITAELRIARAIDFAHPALSDERDDFV